MELLIKFGIFAILVFLFMKVAKGVKKIIGIALASYIVYCILSYLNFF